MHKQPKNEKALKELLEYSKSVSLPLQEVLLSDEHLDRVSTIFYTHMPKMVRWSMNTNKFKDFYKANRESFAESMKG